MANLRQALYAWRENEAAKKSVELFRVLPGSALDEIVKMLPRTKEELTAIKGIKDAKFREYGQAILALVDEHVPSAGITIGDNPLEDSPLKEDPAVLGAYGVSAYLDIVNNALWRLSARVKGEITSFKFQGSALYLGIKDSEDESVMSVFMWSADFALSGIEMREGLEVIVEGKSEIYKPSGRFNFRAQTIELVGEGALKKAYEALKKKLDTEGLFAPEKKRTLPEFPERIGLITSKTGAVIHDFLNNLGKFGYQVRFVDSRVEGVAAIKDLLGAIAQLKKEPLDVLVLVRGGGSLESLQAFNNELVVRALALFPVPVVCAIGHDKDVPLAQMVADYAPSTPTACTALLNDSWERVGAQLGIYERDILSAMTNSIWESRTQLATGQMLVTRYFKILSEAFEAQAVKIQSYVSVLESTLALLRKEAREYMRLALMRYRGGLLGVGEMLKKLNAELEAHNPMRQLKLGYSILSQKGKILRSIQGKEKGEHFQARLSDGIIEAQIQQIHTN